MLVPNLFPSNFSDVRPCGHTLYWVHRIVRNSKIYTGITVITILWHRRRRFMKILLLASKNAHFTDIYWFFKEGQGNLGVAQYISDFLWMPHPQCRIKGGPRTLAHEIWWPTTFLKPCEKLVQKSWFPTFSWRVSDNLSSIKSEPRISSVPHLLSVTRFTHSNKNRTNEMRQ